MPVRKQALDGEVTLLPGISTNLLKSSKDENTMESRIITTQAFFTYTFVKYLKRAVYVYVARYV
jgi:hypothetical protein